MTLIVAKRIDEFIQIEADSRLTSEEQIFLNPYLFGALKTIIVNKNICVSFAGLVEKNGINYPKTAFEQIFLNKQILLEEVLNILTKVHEQSSYEIEFIVGYQDNNNNELIKIQNAQIYRNGDNFWIGDINGFNIFQAEFLSKSSNKELSSEDKSDLMNEAFKKVIDNETVTSVDGLIVSVSSKKGYFKYIEGINLDIHKKTIIKPGETQALPFGEAEDGSFGIAYFVNEKNSPYAIATYFPQGKIGVLYFPQASLEKIIINNVSDEAFIEIISKKYGIELSGFILDLQKGEAKYIGKEPGKFRLISNIEYTTEPTTKN